MSDINITGANAALSRVPALDLYIKDVEKLPFVYRDERIRCVHVIPDQAAPAWSSYDVMDSDWQVETFDGYLIIDGKMKPGMKTDVRLHLEDMRYLPHLQTIEIGSQVERNWNGQHQLVSNK